MRENRRGWGSKIGRKENKEKKHMRAEKEECGRVPVKSGLKQKVRAHMRAEKEEAGAGPS